MNNQKIKTRVYCWWDTPQNIANVFKDTWMDEYLDNQIELVTGDDYDAMIVLNGHKEPWNINCPVNKRVGFDMEPAWSTNRDPNICSYVGKLWSHNPGTESNREFAPPPMISHLYPKPAHIGEVVADMGVSIREVSGQTYKKTKKLSIVVSNIRNYERYGFVQKLLRSDIEFDMWGRGWGQGMDSRYKGYLEVKLDAMADYEYSICLENSSMLGYISEKFIDATLCGTIPIYWGAPDVKEWYGDCCHVLDINSDNAIQQIKDIISAPPAISTEGAKQFYLNTNNPLYKCLTYLKAL